MMVCMLFERVFHHNRHILKKGQPFLDKQLEKFNYIVSIGTLRQ